MTTSAWSPRPTTTGLLESMAHWRSHSGPAVAVRTALIMPPTALARAGEPPATDYMGTACASQWSCALSDLRCGRAKRRTVAEVHDLGSFPASHGGRLQQQPRWNAAQRKWLDFPRCGGHEKTVPRLATRHRDVANATTAATNGLRQPRPREAGRRSAQRPCCYRADTGATRWAAVCQAAGSSGTWFARVRSGRAVSSLPTSWREGSMHRSFATSPLPPATLFACLAPEYIANTVPAVGNFLEKTARHA